MVEAKCSGLDFGGVAVLFVCMSLHSLWEVYGILMQSLSLSTHNITSILDQCWILVDQYNIIISTMACIDNLCCYNVITSTLNKHYFLVGHYDQC